MFQLVLPKMQKLDLHDMWFQQSAATCHTAHVTMDLLRVKLDEHFILRSGAVNFGSLEYFLCGMFKLMSIQTSSLQLKHWKATLKNLFGRYRPKWWKEYANIELSGWDHLRRNRVQHLHEIILKRYIIWTVLSIQIQISCIFRNLYVDFF